MASLSHVLLVIILPICASEPCQHEECQADRSVLLQHGIKKHEHNASGPSSQIGSHGCYNYQSASLKTTWTQNSYGCEWECSNTAGCVGFQWLSATQTICKSSDQKYGSCQLWKEACNPNYDPTCRVWLQYKMTGTASGGCTSTGHDMWATGRKLPCCSGRECNVDGKLMCYSGWCPQPAPSPPPAHGCTSTGHDMWATGRKLPCCSGRECNVDGKLMCYSGSCSSIGFHGSGGFR
eukprot:TRINITY_DN1631_c0_g1_i5.p1 TRINITY_DN1631_c0_g1~~TRINITY_DN1631_c0_g1_i5.p1  ORF type:complete len:236 (-),score=14.33 TRINITY_DN1631_c0_g1_i5:192-899(-)